MDRMPAGWEPPIEWRYPIRVYPNPTCPIYSTVGSFLQVRDVSYLPYPIISYRRPVGGESYGLDNHLATYQLALKPKGKSAL